jgi:hypothetical protein
MINVPVQAPAELAVIPEVIAVPSKVMVISGSLAPKPEPVTVTRVPGGPTARLIVIEGFTTMNTITGTEPTGVTEPNAPILCNPVATDGTVNELFQFPEELAMIPETTRVLSKVTAIPVSLLLKPEPVMPTLKPGGPLVRLTLICGEAA